LSVSVVWGVRSSLRPGLVGSRRRPSTPGGLPAHKGVGICAASRSAALRNEFASRRSASFSRISRPRFAGGPEARWTTVRAPFDRRSGSPGGYPTTGEGMLGPVLVAGLERSEPTVRVIRVWAIAVRVIWVRAIRRCRCRRIVVWRRCSGSRGTDYGARRDTGGNPAPAWSIIAPAADVDVSVDIDVSVNVGAIEIPAVDVGTVKVPAVNTASGGTSPGTSSGGTGAVDAASGVSSAAAITTAPSAAITTASPSAETTAPAASTAALHEHQRCISRIRCRGGNISGHAASPDRRDGARFRSHQSDQNDRCHV
jgi:hypothetical protein